MADAQVHQGRPPAAVAPRAGRQPLDRRTDAGVGFVVAWWRDYWLAVWFSVISAIRLTSRIAEGPGVDARLYVDAGRAWLAGQDPWQVNLGGLYFAAPPPTLLATVPFSLLPGAMGAAALFILGLAGSLFATRRLGLPLWWLAFPPLVDALWTGNPQTLLLPLLLSSAPLVRALAPLVKVYAGVPLLLRPDMRALILGAILLVVTAPLVPWGLFWAEAATVLDRLRLQAGPGMSAWAAPVLVPVAVAGLIVLPRERARWLAAPVLWPATQWYYATLALPACTPLAAALLSVQVPGLFALVPIAALVDLHGAGLVGRLRSTLRPRRAE